MADRWLNYADAASVVGMSVEGVRQRARREGWRKQLGNDGKALILVPDDAARLLANQLDGEERTAAPSKPVTARSPLGDNPGDLAVLHARVVELEGRAAELRADVERERERAERERYDRLQERERADQERARADRLTDEVASLARQLASTISQAKDEAAASTARMETMKAELEAIRSRPWWRRLTG